MLHYLSYYVILLIMKPHRLKMNLHIQSISRNSNIVAHARTQNSIHNEADANNKYIITNKSKNKPIPKSNSKIFVRDLLLTGTEAHTARNDKTAEPVVKKEKPCNMGEAINELISFINLYRGDPLYPQLHIKSTEIKSIYDSLSKAN